MLLHYYKIGCEADPPVSENCLYRLIKFPIHAEGPITSCALYFCSTGYELEGEYYNYCRDGEWTLKDPPVCNVIGERIGYNLVFWHCFCKWTLLIVYLPSLMFAFVRSR